MDFSSLKNKLLILLCVFVFIFPFFCITGFCAEPEIVDYEVVNNLSISAESNYFAYNNSLSVGYFELDKNYKYTITATYGRSMAFSNSVPAENLTYNYIGFLSPGNSYTFIPTSDYFYFTYSNSGGVTITREPINAMADSVKGLVDNVGINSIWNIFDISINYIVIVVLFAFGCFLIFTIIRKISKGKGDV